jgi:excinuclease ABC subunit C
VLYVGKARSLKKRVTNYTRIGRCSPTGSSGWCADATMEFVTTRTETEALLLEANLIKRCGRASTCCCATTSRFRIF